MNGKETGLGEDSLKVQECGRFAEQEPACKHSSAEENMQVTQKPDT